MSTTQTQTRSVVVERLIAFAPEKIWRALTQPQLMQEWLMKSDFQPVAGHAFKFTADWGAVDCTVLEVEANRALSYSWDAMGLESTVTWTLTPTGGGTHLRMEQTGFKPDQKQAFGGAMVGWQRMLTALEAVLARAD